MTSIFQAIILGIIQGITEWLPISSSGHLVITKYLFGLQPDVLFDVMLHYGSLIVIFLVFYKEINKIIFSFFCRKYKRYRKLAYLIIIGSIPTAMIGFYFHDMFEKLFSDIFVVSIALIITGCWLYSTKLKVYVSSRRWSNNWLKSLVIGIAQSVAIIPGISRSGSTISTGLLLGLGRKEAARFSFLLAIPAIFGATLYEVHNSPNLVFSESYLFPIIFGTLASIIIGYISLKWLLSIINKGKLYKFAYYCWIVGLVVLIVSLL